MIEITKTILPSPEWWVGVIGAMRNPKKSWDKIDSYMTVIEDAETLETVPFEFFMGDKDLKLATNLASAGAVHAKYLRMIPVMVTINSNHTFWAEFDTYKVGTVRNSCSKMHTIHLEPFTEDCFSREGIEAVGGNTKRVFTSVVNELETLRKVFNETKETKYWRAIIDLLPMGFNLKATVTLNYQVLANMYEYRNNHKMIEWREFCNWIESLPYAKELIFPNKED